MFIMNNKGFTLIELLAVIVILASMSLVVIASVSSSLERRDTKECEEQIELAKNAAKIYFSLENKNSVTISTLKEKNYFNETSKTNRLKDDSSISVESNKYIYNGECK